MNYKAGFECNDGARLSFKFESDHRIVRKGQINIMTNPLLTEVTELINQRKSNPKSKMHQHGGYKKLTYIENTDTGTIQFYDLW